MLLSRKEGEAVYLDLPDGRRITVVVTEIRRGDRKVRLGFIADADVIIRRDDMKDDAKK